MFGMRPIRFHDIRHSYATMFVENEGSIHALSGVLGHSTAAMTAKYAHYSPEHARRIVDVVAIEVPKSAEVVSLESQRRLRVSGGQNLVTES